MIGWPSVIATPGMRSSDRVTCVEITGGFWSGVLPQFLRLILMGPLETMRVVLLEQLHVLALIEN